MMNAEMVKTENWGTMPRVYNRPIPILGDHLIAREGNIEIFILRYNHKFAAYIVE